MSAVDPGLAAWAADLREVFPDCKTAWFQDASRTWGQTAEARARAAGGQGIAVQASAACRPGKPLKEKR